MLAKRIIPCLDVKEGRVVKGVKFKNLRDAGDPVEVAKIYDEQGADELTFLDITASYEKRKIILDVVRKTAEDVFMPLTIGGGIRDLDDIRELLKAGADKVSMNTAAVENPEFVEKAAKKFGCQCIVVAIDAKRVRSDESGVGSEGLRVKTQGRVQSAKCKVQNPPNPPLSKGGLGGFNSELRTPNSQLTWEVYTHGGRNPTGIDVIAWAKKVEEMGAGEILLTSMDFDGTKMGFDLELTRAVSDAVGIPIIASGGVGSLEHIYDGLVKGKADAALAASIFHYGEYTVGEVKSYLMKMGVEVRL